MRAAFMGTAECGTGEHSLRLGLEGARVVGPLEQQQ